MDIMPDKYSSIYDNIIKTCNIIYELIKLDTMVIDKHCNSVYELAHHPLPSIFCSIKEDYAQVLHILEENPPNYYYHYITPYRLEYIAAGIWEDELFSGMLLVGPFLSTVPNEQFIQKVIMKNKLPVNEHRRLYNFYQSLSIVSYHFHNYLGTLLINLCRQPLIDSKSIADNNLQSIQPFFDRKQLNKYIYESKHTIESRYKMEKKLMDAVSKGDKEKLFNLIKENKEFKGILDFIDRIPESPIRSAKNITFVLNTLLRIAAERGGLHPVYLHAISERFAISIEKCTTLAQLKALERIMLEDYCEAVRTLSNNHYSPIVKKAIDYIHLNLDSHLTLSKIAESIHVNPSHLSRQFKKEVKMTIINYINKKRIDMAKLYLEKNENSITDIAMMVGFNDPNYFSKVFKKLTSMSPSEYVKQKHRANR